MANINSEVPPVLTCWKDIAQYLGKGVRTVQRWEQEFGLPVRRPNGIDHKSPVAAHPDDLDAWLQTRWSARNGRKDQQIQASGNGARSVKELSESIRIARELRSAHLALMTQTSMAIQALVNSCSELELTKFNRRQN
jgi:hypothetical protein